MDRKDTLLLKTQIPQRPKTGLIPLGGEALNMGRGKSTDERVLEKATRNDVESLSNRRGPTQVGKRPRAKRKSTRKRVGEAHTAPRDLRR